MPDFRDIGYCTIENLLTPMQVEEARRKVEALYAAGKGDTTHKGTIIYNLTLKDPWFIGLLDNPMLEEPLKILLNVSNYPGIPPDAPNYIIGEFIARSSGAKGLGVHMDSYAAMPGKQLFMAQVIIALEDRGVDEGCTAIVPDSHLLGRTPYDRPPGERLPLYAVPLKAGDAILLDSRLWHGTGPRKSESKAWALIITFQQWWIRQRYDISGALSDELKESLSPKLLTLLGYYAKAPPDEYAEGYNGGYLRAYDSK